jgi:hypothetical protein
MPDLLCHDVSRLDKLDELGVAQSWPQHLVQQPPQRLGLLPRDVATIKQGMQKRFVVCWRHNAMPACQPALKAVVEVPGNRLPFPRSLEQLCERLHILRG